MSAHFSRFATVLLIATAAAPALAQRADPPWPPLLNYSLGPSLQARTVTSTQTQVTVFAQRPAPLPGLPAPTTDSPQSVFNIGGDPFARPADCPLNTTTVAGQPASPQDLAGPVGVRSCYF